MLSTEEEKYNGDCKIIYNYLLSKSGEYVYTKDLINCTTNDQGQVENISLYPYCLDNFFDDILAYPSIKKIYFDLYDVYHSSNPELDHLRGCPSRIGIPNSIFKLENLETIDLYGIGGLNEKDISNLPKSLQNLFFGKLEMTQNVIKELTLLPNLKYLYFQKTKFNDSLNFDPIKNIKTLTELTLSNAENFEFTSTKKYLNTDIIKYIPNIKKLNIDHYTLSQNNVDYIGSLINLEELTIINGGYDDDLNLDPLKNLTKLKTLILQGTTSHCSEDLTIYDSEYCPLHTVPEFIFNMPNLTKLIISDQYEFNLPNITEDTIKTSKIEYLNLSKNSFTEIPNSFGYFTNLKYLNLNKNNLSDLFSSIGNLKNLAELYINDNSITVIPDSLMSIKNLKILSITDNNITSLPQNIGNLVKLETLNLSSNMIEEIPSSIKELMNLKELIIKSNKLTELPITIGNLNSLEKLDLNYNEIKSIPESIGNLKNLADIISILPQSFGKLVNLKKINMNSNKLITLPDSIGNLKNLKTLSIYNNQIVSLPNTISDLINLEDL
ncbi:hypothetical protein PIROE2DRAFT_5721 [Piromyces sp. E2]|nr:hypothetical protein PIROE2DRAFT_5721 [Piromyces sp. E2]|eukprot:OUM66979.1 hypothetical protein PIROE2DRAFT_5721 [Piromyces sp. E2]